MKNNGNYTVLLKELNCKLNTKVLCSSKIPDVDIENDDLGPQNTSMSRPLDSYLI